MIVRCLAFHAEYACRHSGACCTAGWPIPVEGDRLAVLESARAAGRFGSPSARTLWLRPADAPADTPAVLESDAHGCVFFEPTPGGQTSGSDLGVRPGGQTSGSDLGVRPGGQTWGPGLCRIQRVLSHNALPLACRQFPRVSLHDPRGTSVTLSHFCPTAAALLDAGASTVVVERALAFPPDAELIGLDVRSALPPLLRPDLLMDWNAWWTWERRAVETIADARASPEEALNRLSGAIEMLRGWCPADGPLTDEVDRAFAHREARAPRRARDAATRRDEILGAIPAGFRPPSPDGTGMPSAAVVRRLLAAHAFASWIAHLGRGLRCWLRSLDAVVALLELGFSVRQVDLLLRHLSDTQTLADTWSRAEQE